MRSVLPMVSWICIGMVGCGGDCTVSVTGLVSVEGEPASSGYLIFLPLGQGKRAVSLVAEDGAFALRTGSTLGALPGEYRVMFKRSLGSEQPAAKRGLGEESAEEISVMYYSPAKDPLGIPDTGAEDMQLDIRKTTGWTRELAE